MSSAPSTDPGTGGSRTVEVAAARLVRWVAGFGERHGDLSTRPGQEVLELRAEDGATALLRVPFPPWEPVPDADAAAQARALAAHVTAPRRVAVLIVRRGGFAAVVVDDGQVVASKVGRRHVQGRTAAGGWSQQRFARRRAKQTDELADAAAETAARVLGTSSTTREWAAGEGWLVTGGDRPLLDRVLAVPALRAVAGSPRGAHLAVGDPDARLVASLPELLTRVPVTLTEPSP